MSSESLLVCSSRNTKSVEPQPNAIMFQIDFLSLTSPGRIVSLQLGHFIMVFDEQNELRSIRV